MKSNETAAQWQRSHAAAEAAMRVSLQQLSDALLKDDVLLLKLVRDAHRLAGVNVKVEMR